jgi:hypothetical protein
VKLWQFSGKPDSTSTSTRSESPTSSSSKSVTPTARPCSSSKKSRTKGVSAPSKEHESAYRIDKGSSYTPLTNSQHNSIPAAKTATTTFIKASKKTSGNKPAGCDNTAKYVVKPDKALKNITATPTKARSNDSPAGASDLKADVSKARRLSRPPPGTTASNGKVQIEGVKDTVATKGKREARTGAVPATGKGAGSTQATAKGRTKSGGEKEQRPKLGSHPKK